MKKNKALKIFTISLICFLFAGLGLSFGVKSAEAQMGGGTGGGSQTVFPLADLFKTGGPGNSVVQNQTPVVDSSCGDLTFQCIVSKVISTILNPLVALMIGLAVVFFIINLVKLLQGDLVKEKKEAKDLMIYSIIAIAVMVSVWGLVQVVVNTFFSGADLSSPPSIPYL